MQLKKWKYVTGGSVSALRTVQTRVSDHGWLSVFVCFRLVYMCRFDAPGASELFLTSSKHFHLARESKRTLWNKRWGELFANRDGPDNTCNRWLSLYILGMQWWYQALWISDHLYPVRLYSGPFLVWRPISPWPKTHDVSTASCASPRWGSLLWSGQTFGCSAGFWNIMHWGQASVFRQLIFLRRYHWSWRIPSGLVSRLWMMGGLLKATY